MKVLDHFKYILSWLFNNSFPSHRDVTVSDLVGAGRGGTHELTQSVLQRHISSLSHTHMREVK